MNVSEGKPAPTLAETVIRAAAAAVPASIGDALEIVVGDAIARRHERIREAAQQIVAHSRDPERLVQRLHRDERLAGMFLSTLETASRTHLKAKRHLMARVVARATEDDARIDEADLLITALRDLDAPHFRALERIRTAEDEARRRVEDEGTPENTSEPSIVADVVRQVSGDEPEPIRSALIRTGVAIPATVYGGGIVIYRLSDFGRKLLDDLRASGLDEV